MLPLFSIMTLYSFPNQILYVMDARRHAHLWTIAESGAIKKKESQRKREIWCKTWLTRRHNLGSYAQIFQELRCATGNDLEIFI